MIQHRFTVGFAVVDYDDWEDCTKFDRAGNPIAGTHKANCQYHNHADFDELIEQCSAMKTMKTVY